MTFSRIRVPATWRDDTGRQHTRIANFELGLGPCGKVAVRLETETTLAGFTVAQECSDGEVKEFFYPMHTLTGRVEMTYKD